MAKASGTSGTISRAHKIKLDPNREQEYYLERACYARRFVYNWALAEWNRQYKLHKEDEKNPKPTKNALCRQLTQEKSKKPEMAWLNDFHAHMLGKAVEAVARGWSNWFKALKRGDCAFRPPKFAVKGKQDRFYVHQRDVQFDESGKHVKIAMWSGRRFDVRCRETLRLNGKIMSGTVSRAADGWYLSVQVDIPHVKKAHKAGGEVGVDMGVANVVALSDGQRMQLPKELGELTKRLRRVQKTLSRRWSGKPKKGHEDKALRDEQGQLLPKSRRFMKQKRRLARLHQRIANVRADALHKLSRWIVDHYDVIAVEELKIRNMTGSAKGTVEEPGRNVRSKAGLNRAMLNVALRQLRIMMEYKADAAGGRVAAVEPAYTSLTCSKCGHVDEKNRISQAEFKCVKCGHEEHADVNAARNILARLKEKGR